MATAANMRVWDAGDEYSDSLQFDVQEGVGPVGAVVSIWAGDDDDPGYLTPAAARRLAADLPALLLELADAAEEIAAKREGTTR